MALLLGGFGSAIVLSATEMTNGAESNCGTLVFTAKRSVSLCDQPLRDRTILVVACLAIAAVGAFGLSRARPPFWSIVGGVAAGGMAIAAALVSAVPVDPTNGDCGSVLGPYSYTADVIGCKQIDDRRTLAIWLLGAAIALVFVCLVVATSSAGRRSTAEAHR